MDNEIEQQNNTVCRTTGLSPNDASDKAIAENRNSMRLCPDPSLLGLHLALYFSRRLNMPITKLTFWAAAGPSGLLSAAPWESSTIQVTNSGLSPHHSNHPKTGVRMCSENSCSDPVSFCSHIKSHFELPPTFATLVVGREGHPTEISTTVWYRFFGPSRQIKSSFTHPLPHSTSACTP